MQFVMSRLLFPIEYNHLIGLGCKVPPHVLLCGIVRNFYMTYQTMPSLEQLIISQYTPCDSNCDNYIIYEEAIPIIKHGVIEYGYFFNCQWIYSVYLFKFINERFPRTDEIEMEERDNFLNNTMNQNIDEFWENCSSSIDWSKCKKEKITKVPSYSCAICQEDFEMEQDIITLPCEHVYHMKSETCEGIENWLVKINTCPLCKKEI